MKRVIALLTAMVITIVSVFSTYPSCGKVACAAKANYQSYYNEYAMSLSNRCLEYQRYLTNIGSKQFGLLYSLRILTQYSEYVHFMITYYGNKKEKLGISDRTVSVYETDLHEEFESFNARFASDSKDYAPLKISHYFTGEANSDNQDAGKHKTARDDIEVFVVKTVPEYLSSLLKDIQDDIVQARGDKTKEEKVKSDNATLLMNIYAVCLYAQEAKSDLGTMTPFYESGKNKGKHKRYNLSHNNSSMEDAYASLMKDYADLMEIAKKVFKRQQVDDDITLDLSKAYISNLSDAVVTENGTEIPDSPNLSKLYYAIMAAGSVYVPLQSYAGNSAFQAAVKDLTNDDQVQQQIVEFYSSVKDIRKPLYKRELDEDGNPTGTATLVTIEKFFKDIREKNSGALCAILGRFSYSSSSGSWIYYQDNTRNLGNDYSKAANNQDTTVNTSDETDAATLYEPVDNEDHADGDYDEESNDSEPADADEDTETDEGDTDLQHSLSGLFSGIIGKTAYAAKAEETPQPEQSNDGNTLQKSDETSGQNGTDENTIDNSGVFAYSDITDETKMTDALYFYGCDYSRDVDNMTFSLMNNILNSSSNLQYISDKSTRCLYINAFGDIVTDDNLVIFPGIANPLMYRDTESYNPYTAAFMNFYPTSYWSSRTFKLTNKNGIGKYLICKQTSNKSSDALKLYSLQTESINSIKSTSPLINRDIFLDFSVDGNTKIQMLQYRRMIFGADSKWNEDNALYLYTPLVINCSAQIDGISVFPYVMNEDHNFSVAKAIAKNMYWYLTTDTKTNSNEASVKRFNDNYILHNFLISGVSGTNNPKGYSTNVLEQYQKYVENSNSRFLSKLMDLSSIIVDSVSGVQGVIGLRESLQNPILGRVLTFCKSNILFFFLVIAVILLAAFAKMGIDRFQMIIKFLVCMLATYLSITIIPTYLPMIFNIVINNVSENLSYKIMATQIEKDSIGELEKSLNEDGTEKLNSDSITVYRSGTLNYQEFVNNVNVEESDLTSGNIVVINEESGLYAEGDSLKINAFKLYGTLKIAKDDAIQKKEGSNGSGTLSYKLNESGRSPIAEGASEVYKLKAYKTVSNNLDYYAPYYQIVDSFIGNMNKLQDIVNVPRSTIVYSNGVIKDNFLVYSFVNSQVFLTPGSYDSVPSVEGLTSDEEEAIAAEASALSNDLLKAFGHSNKASDFLGLSGWLRDPTLAMRKTLWYKSMAENGYYDKKTGEANKGRMDHLISKVNRVTKNFIFEMDDLIGQVSDDTMIKIISTRAMIALCQEISEVGNWVYPFSLNYGDFSLKEVIGSVFISNYQKFTAMNLDVVDYVGFNYGWFNLIMLDVLVVLLFLITWVVQLLISVLYLLLCISFIIKLLAQGDGKAPLKGFFKCSVIIMVCYTVLALGLVLAERSNGSPVCIYFMLAICLLISYVLSVVVTSVLSSWADVGNSAVNVKMKNAFDLRRAGQKVGSIRAGQIIAGRHSRQHTRYGRYDNGGYRVNYGNEHMYSMYDYDSPVDAMYEGSTSYGAGIPYENNDAEDDIVVNTAGIPDVEDLSAQVYNNIEDEEDITEYR